MSVTFNCRQVGKNALWNKSAFEGRDVQISNPYKQLSNDDFNLIQTFITKKESAEFCKKWGFHQTGLIQVSSRFQTGWAVFLGRSSFAPDHAEGLLIAHRMGCVVEKITF